MPIRPKFGTITTITITLASLANNAARESDAINNESDLAFDVEIYLAIKLAVGAPAGDKKIYLYAYGSVDGTNYTDNATGVNAAITLRSPTNLYRIAEIATPDSGAVTYKGIIASIANSMGGGVLPSKWGIVVENKTGLAFDATEGNHTKQYKVLQAENV